MFRIINYIISIINKVRALPRVNKCSEKVSNQNSKVVAAADVLFQGLFENVPE